MDDIFEQIALELRHQYSIGYKPSNFSNDGKWRKIKVKVTPPRGLPRLFVRSKEGYYESPTHGNTVFEAVRQRTNPPLASLMCAQWTQLFATLFAPAFAT